MKFLVEVKNKEVNIIGRVAEGRGKLTCEGCGDKVKVLYEDAGMNMLCEKCIKLP